MRYNINPLCATAHIAHSISHTLVYIANPVRDLYRYQVSYTWYLSYTIILYYIIHILIPSAGKVNEDRTVVHCFCKFHTVCNCV